MHIAQSRIFIPAKQKFHALKAEFSDTNRPNQKTDAFLVLNPEFFSDQQSPDSNSSSSNKKAGINKGLLKKLVTLFERLQKALQFELKSPMKDEWKISFQELKTLEIDKIEQFFNTNKDVIRTAFNNKSALGKVITILKRLSQPRNQKNLKDFQSKKEFLKTVENMTGSGPKTREYMEALIKD